MSRVHHRGMIVLVPVAFVAGILSFLAPCTLAMLPLIVGASATGGARRPLGIVTGLALTFVTVTVALAAILAALGLTTATLRWVAVLGLALVGASLLVPALTTRFERALAPLAGIGAPVGASGIRRDGFVGGLLVGAALGLIWAPCVGPIMAGVIAAAISTGPTVDTVVVAIAYAAGAAIPFLIVADRGRAALRRLDLFARRDLGRRIAGIAMLTACLAVATGADLAVSTTVARALDRGTPAGMTATDEATPVGPVEPPLLPDLGPAAEFAGITEWINSSPQTMASLRGKVVLVHFWTFGCYNCRNVQPYVKAWYDEYHDQGLEIISIHTPELSFEREIANVREAVIEQGVRYPVAFDPAFATWRAFANGAWPAFHYIDREGRIRFLYGGEGAYEQQEAVIRALLAESPAG